jgi:uracil-DNA glycosylase family 4
MQRIKGQGNSKAKIFIVGMAPEKNEVLQNKPFVGWSGQCLDRALAANGVNRDDCFATNISEVPLYEFGREVTSLHKLPNAFIDSELNRLKREIMSIQPNIIFCLGDEPSYFITNKDKITKLRGSILPSVLVPGFKCLVTVHPAWIQRGMWRWLSIFQGIDIAKGVQESKNSKLSYPSITEHIAPTAKRVQEFCHEALKQPWTTFDIETIAWNKNRPGSIACIGLGWKNSEAMCIPFLQNKTKAFYSESDEVKVWRSLAEVLESETQKIGQNFSFDWLYLWLYGIYPKNPYIDTMLLHHCLYPDFGGVDDFFGRRGKRLDKPGHSLGFINSCYTSWPYYKDDSKFWESGDVESLWHYNIKDVVVTHTAAIKLMQEAVAAGMWQYFNDIYMDPFLPALVSEWDGIEIDTKMRDLAHAETSERIKAVQELLEQNLGFKINVASPPQVRELLYTHKHYQVKKNKQTGKVSADKYVLEYFATKYQDPDLKNIMEIKKLRDFRSDILEQNLDTNNRIHTHWKIGGTNGARWSSGKGILGNGTNFQNIPRKGLARRLFIAS